MLSFFFLTFLVRLVQSHRKPGIVPGYGLFFPYDQRSYNPCSVYVASCAGYLDDVNGNAYLELLRLLMPYLPMSREAQSDAGDDDSDDEDDQMMVGEVG